MEVRPNPTKSKPTPRRPTIIIVSGPPASGKTFIGQKIAQDFHLPFFNKDSIKETLFDQLGWSDMEWSRKLNAASLEILYKISSAQLAAGCSHVLESNFKPAIDTTKFLALRAQYQCKFIQIQCVTEGSVLLERFKQRAKSGKRHPGHVDYALESYLEPLLLMGRQGNLAIGDALLEVDTTDFDKFDYAGLTAFISERLTAERRP